MRAHRLAVALVAFTSCSSGSSHDGTPATPQPPDPPPGTGTSTIEMNGTWTVVELTRTDGGPALPTPMPGASPFLPVQLGQVLVVQNDTLTDGYGAPLFDMPDPAPTDFYANECNGRTLWFELVHMQSEPCFSQLGIRAIFGSDGADRMLGFVDVMTMTTCLQGQFLTTNPNGGFLVRLQRDPEPAQAISDR